MESNTRADTDLWFLEGVRDAASIVLIRAVEDIALARPATARPYIVVPGVGGYAPVPAAAAARCRSYLLAPTLTTVRSLASTRATRRDISDGRREGIYESVRILLWL